jgi:hypothetical protein
MTLGQIDKMGQMGQMGQVLFSADELKDICQASTTVFVNNNADADRQTGEAAWGTESAQLLQVSVHVPSAQ